MFEVEVFIFHPQEGTKKETMLYSEFLKIKKDKRYRYVAYQVGYNKTIFE